jgi:phage portal protein BeeE
VREVGIAGEDMAAVFYEIGDNPLVDLEGLLGPQASRLIVPARDVLHVKLATPSHPLIGETWLGALASELAQRGAINAATTQAAANMRPAGILTTDLTLTRAQINEISDLWKEKSANMAHGGVPVLQQGIKFQPVTMSADDAKTIEQLKLNDRAVAAVFGVPAILLGISDSATQKSAEAVMAEWLAAGLGWLINHVEVAFDQFIGLNQVAGGREWVEFDTRMLLRSLYKERIDGLVRGVQGGLYSPNEARAMEGYGAVKDGEEPRLQAQVVPLSAWSSTAPATSTPATSPVAESEEEPEETEDEDDRAFAVVQIARRLEAKRASERQAAA